jgi:hypothetical protein
MGSSVAVVVETQELGIKWVTMSCLVCIRDYRGIIRPIHDNVEGVWVTMKGLWANLDAPFLVCHGILESYSGTG